MNHRSRLLLTIVFTFYPPLAMVAGDAEARQFTHRAIFPCSVAEAWHLWTTNEGVQKGIGVQGSDIELKLSGKYEIYFGMTFPVGQRGTEGCTVLSYHPLEMLAFSWNAPPTIPDLRSAGARTQVVIRFKSLAADQTEVTLTHLGIGSGKSWDQYLAYFKNAWPSVTKHMIEYLQKPDRSTKSVAVPAGLNALVHEGIIDAHVTEMWNAFTTKAGLESWMVPQASFDLKIGGKMQTTYNMTARLGDEHTIENTVRAYVPESMLTFQCTRVPKGFPFEKLFSQVWTICYFDAVNEKQTKVRFVGLNYGSDEESLKLRKHFESGNAQVLEALKKRFQK